MLVDVNIAKRRRCIGVFTGLPQQLVKFFLEHLGVDFMFGKRLLKDLFATAGFALQASDAGLKVFQQPRFFGRLMTDHGRSIRVDLQLGPATRALDFDQVFVRVAHSKILTQREALRFILYASLGYIREGPVFSL
jgi:hypothetical protein